jgi:hypothetical protein
VTFYDDPNREAVGVAPIWTVPEVEPEPEASAEDPAEEDAAASKTGRARRGTSS